MTKDGMNPLEVTVLKACLEVKAQAAARLDRKIERLKKTVDTLEATRHKLALEIIEMYNKLRSTV